MAGGAAARAVVRVRVVRLCPGEAHPRGAERCARKRGRKTEEYRKGNLIIGDSLFAVRFQLKDQLTYFGYIDG